MNMDDLRRGCLLYTTDGRDVWRVKYWCEYPTVTLENMETKEVCGGAVQSLIMEPFVKLIPERIIDENTQR